MTRKEKIGAIIFVLLCLYVVLFFIDARESSRHHGYYGSDFELIDDFDYAFTSDRFWTNAIARKFLFASAGTTEIIFIILIVSMTIGSWFLIPKCWYKKKGVSGGEYPFLIQKFELVKECFPET